MRNRRLETARAAHTLMEGLQQTVNARISSKLSITLQLWCIYRRSKTRDENAQRQRRLESREGYDRALVPGAVATRSQSRPAIARHGNWGAERAGLQGLFAEAGAGSRWAHPDQIIVKLGPAGAPRIGGPKMRPRCFLSPARHSSMPPSPISIGPMESGQIWNPSPIIA